MADPGGWRFSGLFKRMVYKIANANLLINTNIVPRERNHQGKIMKPRTRRGLQTDIECSWLPFSAYASNLL